MMKQLAEQARRSIQGLAGRAAIRSKAADKLEKLANELQKPRNSSTS